MKVEFDILQLDCAHSTIAFHGGNKGRFEKRHGLLKGHFFANLSKRSHFSLKNLDLVSNFEIKDRNSRSRLEA